MSELIGKQIVMMLNRINQTLEMHNRILVTYMAQGGLVERAEAAPETDSAATPAIESAEAAQPATQGDE